MKAVGIMVAAILVLAGCAAAPPKAVPPPPAAPAPLDHSYDWHVLVSAPLGSVFKDMPFALHEVLLFRDDAKHSDGDVGECYAIDGTAPSFVSRVPDDYLLCFKHDRLAHIEATVRVPQDQAEQIFADACSLWFKNAALPAPVITVANESTPAICSGHDGAAQFSGRLEVEAESGAAPGASALGASASMSVRIDAMDPT
jgi:hypothetical protein